MKDRRLLALLSATLLVPVGFGMKAYSGPWAMWVQNSFAGLVYVTFWCLVVGAVLPHARSWVVAVRVTAATGVLEVGQLVEHPALTPVRDHPLGAALLGRSFDWMDFPYYLAGGVLGWALLSVIGRTARRAPDP